MATRRGNRHELAIDGQFIWLDSLNEEIALRRFIDQYGFNGKWERPKHGVKHAGKSYTADFELAVNDYGRTSRAIVEVKQYRKDFTTGMAERMRVLADHYRTDCLFLYVTKSDAWFKLMPRNGMVRPCTPPQPGEQYLTELSLPRRFLTRNYFGRKYYQSFGDKFLASLNTFLFSFTATSRRKRKNSPWGW